MADADQQKLLAEAGAGPFGPTERLMGGYVSLPGGWRSGPLKRKATTWVGQALAHVAAMPPKKPKSAKRT